MYAEHSTGEKELYDLQNDPFELQSRHRQPRLRVGQGDGSQPACTRQLLENCAGSELPRLHRRPAAERGRPSSVRATRGFRFSAKARMPSRKSSEAKHERRSSISSRSCSGVRRA